MSEDELVKEELVKKELAKEELARERKLFNEYTRLNLQLAELGNQLEEIQFNLYQQGTSLQSILEKYYNLISNSSSGSSYKTILMLRDFVSQDAARVLVSGFEKYVCKDFCLRNKNYKFVVFDGEIKFTADEEIVLFYYHIDYQYKYCHC